jgi:hypothetical protein
VHGLFDRFRSELAPANVAAGWGEEGGWRRWPAPSNFITGESHYTDALRALAGPPRQNGYLIPVTVTLVREPENRYDPNAFRAQVGGRRVGYIARQIAAQLAPPLDRCGCSSFQLCGVLRGGSDRAPGLGVHVWLDRRLSAGPELVRTDDAGHVSWPPYEEEGSETPAASGRAHASARPTTAGNAPGFLRGAHYTDYVEQVKQLRRAGLDQEAEVLLLELIDATEAEAAAEEWGVPPWYYEQLAVLYSKRHDYDAEIAVLERYAGQPHASGVSPPRLLERLAKKRAAREKRRGV